MSEVDLRTKAYSLYLGNEINLNKCGTELLKLMTDFYSESLENLIDLTDLTDLSASEKALGSKLNEKSDLVDSILEEMVKSKNDSKLCIEQVSAENIRCESEFSQAECGATQFDSLNICYENKLNQMEYVATQINSLCDFVNSAE
jgi:hypothetical protein